MDTRRARCGNSATSFNVANRLTNRHWLAILLSMTRTVYASAPSRIDFGGGTLDIHPLYLFFDGAMTINAAINLGAEVWITGRDDNQIRITSVDTGATLECDGGVQQLPTDGKLALITRVLRHYHVAGGVDVTTKLLPPVGSGLGASSTLFIALSHAVLAYQDKPREPETIIRVSNNLEAQLMNMPAGTQDYYPPTYGGINAIHYSVDGIWTELLNQERDLFTKLQSHIIISYTNISHHSGTTNWGMMRNCLDGVPLTVNGMRKIKRVADDFYHAFKAQDIRAIGTLLDEEWENRKGLSDGVTTPEINRMMAAARAAGAWANKLCGAGGGGCMLTLAPPEARAAVIAALEANGASYMDANLVEQGVQVIVS